MVRYMKNCGRMSDNAVMEVTQMVGVRTRAMTMALAAAATPTATAVAEEGGMSAKRRREEDADRGLGAVEMQMSYLQLRNRSLMIKQRLSRSARNSPRKRCEGVEQERISRCSSISSCDALEEDEFVRLPSSRTDDKACKDLVSSKCYRPSSQDRREISWSCNVQVSYPSELNSAVERRLHQSMPQSTMPPVSEIEEFFTAVEKAEKQRFATRYNFDIDEDVPLEGRYEWVRINQ